MPTQHIELNTVLMFYIKIFLINFLHENQIEAQFSQAFARNFYLKNFPMQSYFLTTLSIAGIIRVKQKSLPIKICTKILNMLFKIHLSS
jgi:hypothetical protein